MKKAVVLSEADLSLFEAATHGSRDAARLALSAGANVNARLDGETPLHRVATMSSGLVLPILIEAGADVNALSGSSRTPIESTGTSSIALALYACGADTSRPGAFYRENLQMIGRTSAAVRCGIPEWIARALEVETDESMRDFAKSALDSRASEPTLVTITESDWNLVLSSERFTIDSLRSAIESGGDVNVRLHGRTPLHYAVEHHSINVCKALIKAGAHVNEPDCDGLAPLRFTSNLLKARSMIALGADPLGCAPGKVFDALSKLTPIEAACELAETGSRDDSYIADVLLSEADEVEVGKRRSAVEVLLRKDPGRSGAEFMRSWLAREASRDVLRGMDTSTALRSAA